MARHYYWLADDPAISGEEKARLGKLTWDWSDRATQANPARVEAVLRVGRRGQCTRSHQASIKALLDGMESKYLDRSRSPRPRPGLLRPRWRRVLGALLVRAPWPKYDGEKSELAFRKALRSSPTNLRAKVYLAELYIKEDHPVEARKLLDAVLAAKVGALRPTGERRAQGLARAALRTDQVVFHPGRTHDRDDEKPRAGVRGPRWPARRRLRADLQAGGAWKTNVLEGAGPAGP